MAGRPQRGLSVVSIQDDIRKATDPTLKEPDWGKNMQIVDKLSNILVVVPAYGDKVSKELLSRITHKEHQVAILGLGLLETIVKNIPAFHPIIADSKFLKAMVKTLPRRIRKPREKQNVFKSATENKPSTKESIERYDRVLILLQDWATAFKGQLKYEIFEDTYQQLRQRGCIFPVPLKDEICPIFTPEATHQPKKKKPYEIKVSGPSKNKEYTDGECRVANQSVIVFVEMLSESDEKDDLSKNDLIQELLKTIQTYQKKTQTRVMSGISSEVIMAEVLEVNDKMSQALSFYNGLLDGSIKREKKPPPTEFKDPESVELSDSANEDENDQVAEDPFASIAQSSSKLGDSPKLMPLPKPTSSSGSGRRRKKKSKNKKVEKKDDNYDKKPKNKSTKEVNILGDDFFGGNTGPTMDPFAINTGDNPFGEPTVNTNPFDNTTVDPFDMLANNSSNVDPFGSDMFSAGPPPAIQAPVSQPPPSQIEGVPDSQPGGMDDFFDMFSDLSGTQSQQKGKKTDEIDFDDEFLALAKRN